MRRILVVKRYKVVNRSGPYSLFSLGVRIKTLFELLLDLGEDLSIQTVLLGSSPFQLSAAMSAALLDFSADFGFLKTFQRPPSTILSYF